MEINFKIANNLASKFYIAGYCSGNDFFPPIGDKRKKILSSLLNSNQSIEINEIELVYKNFKASVLSGSLMVEDFKKTLEKTLARCKKIKTSKKYSDQKAKNIYSKIVKYYQLHKKIIHSFFDKYKIESNLKFNVYFIPGLGECGESLGETVVMGDGFENKGVVLAVLFEEILHTIDRLGKIKHPRIKGLKDEKIYREAVVGAELFKLLKEMGFKKAVTESVVFGWNGGMRKKWVNQILAKN